jgi:hypothetical protein
MKISREDVLPHNLSANAIGFFKVTVNARRSAPRLSTSLRSGRLPIRRIGSYLFELAKMVDTKIAQFYAMFPSNFVSFVCFSLHAY